MSLYKAKADISATKGKITAGEITEAKILSKKEKEDLIKNGWLKEVETSIVTEEKTIEELLEEPIETLKKTQLEAVCDHYAIDKNGKVEELRHRIIEHEKMLEGTEQD